MSMKKTDTGNWYVGEIIEFNSMNNIKLTAVDCHFQKFRLECCLWK